MNIQTIHDQAMLAYISVSCWSARKFDRKASDEVTVANNAANDSARVNKHLLANADAQLKELQRIAGQARKYLDAHSLPWDDAGNRLLSNREAMVVVGELYTIEQTFNLKADEFVQAYPVLRAQAIASLGTLANDADYPQPDIIRQKFAMKLSLSPIPTGFGDLRLGLSDAQVQALSRHLQQNITDQMEGALRTAWQRLEADVAKVRERMEATPDGERKIFRNSIIDNLRETCDILDSLNVFGSAELTATCKYVREHIAVEPETLRTQETAALQVLANADALLERMRAWV